MPTKTFKVGDKVRFDRRLSNNYLAKNIYVYESVNTLKHIKKLKQYKMCKVIGLLEDSYLIIKFGAKLALYIKPHLLVKCSS